MKCSKTTILNHLKKIKFSNDNDNNTIKNKKINHAKKNILLQDIINLHLQGFTDKEISEKLGCTRNNITTRLNKAGYKNRKEKINNIELRNRISNSLRGNQLGLKNPNYKEFDENKNLTYYYKNRARGLYRTFAKEAIRNSDYKCKICGSKTNALEVHHIKPFQKILNDFLTNAYSGNRESFSEELLKYPDFINKKNLIVLCPTCHREIHLKDNSELSQYLQQN